MKLAVVQTRPVFGDPARNVENALRLLKSQTADLFILPELFNTGYTFSTIAEVQSLAEEIAGPTVATLCQFSRDSGSHVVFGFAERQGDACFNSAALVGPSGFLGCYRKVHLFDREKEFFTAGSDGFPIFRLPFGTVGLMICFDWIFPEGARSLALKGANLIAHPSNLVLPHCPEAMVTRCIENRVFAATADRVGEEDRSGTRLKFIGTSQIISPAGKILCRLDGESEGIGSAEINLSDAANKSVTTRNHLLSDRRIDQYELNSLNQL